MRVLIATESRFDRTPDGNHWNVGSGGYDFWQRYLEVFDEVRILGRVRDVPVAPLRAVRADGPNVSLVPLPYYLGPWAYLRRYPSLRRAARRAADTQDSVILRAPGAAPSLLVSAFGRSGRPFGVEVVGDPYDVFVPGGVRTVLRPLLRRLMTNDIRVQCARACAVAYVTAGFLQRRYPASPAAYVASFSCIDLTDEAFVPDPRPITARDGTQRIVFVGSLEQMYKAPDVLIDAIAAACNRGGDLSLTMVGDGKHRGELEARAIAGGLGNRVRFLGHLPPGDAVRKELDAADLFVLPSRTEGLPRALIEAMARALPCIGSTVGGIPELLSPSEQVPPGEVDALANKILEILGDRQRCSRLSQQNLQRARDYRVDALRPRRRAFYHAVREATTEWQGRDLQRRNALASQSAHTLG
jgi:glycosyltransferase involved in cell wall biosynthesis